MKLCVLFKICILLFVLAVELKNCICHVIYHIKEQPILYFCTGGAVAQSVERATPGQEVPGSIPAVAARSLLVGLVSV